jgi:hypothetical protein
MPKNMSVFTNKPIPWSEFNGLSDSLWSGIKGSFYKFIGLDAVSQPGSLRVQQKLTKDSGTTITDLCKVALTVSDGSRLWFSYTSGKIWRDSGGTYTLVYTTVPTSGNAGCLGAYEYNGNIYWATQNYEHYIAVANIGGNWTANAHPNWQLFGATDANWHPHEVVNASLFIGDNHQVAKVDSSNAFTANALDLIAPNVIKTMKAYDIDLVTGTLINVAVNHSWIVRWDTIQTSWQYMEPVMENGVNCLFWSGQNLLAQAGQYGMIYHYNGRNLLPYKRMPGNWNPSNNGEILPNAANIFRNQAVFGFTADTGNPADQAVYEFGSYSKDYRSILSESFPISSGNLSGITIGAILTSDQNMWVSWQDTGAGTQGVDKLDYTALYSSAYLETMIINLDDVPESFTNIERFFALYQSMPAGCSISFSYYANHGSETAVVNSVKTDAAYQTIYVDEGIDARVLRLRVAFTVSGNNGPVLEAIGILPSV